MHSCRRFAPPLANASSGQRLGQHLGHEPSCRRVRQLRQHRWLAGLGLGLVGSAAVSLGGSLPAIALPQLAQTPAPAAPATPAPAAPAAPNSPDRVARPTLRLGSQGEPVSELQAMLQLLGFYAGPVTGQFQESTQIAVQQFQGATGLTADGIVGAATWSKLLPTPPAEANPPTATAPATPPSQPPAASTPSSAPARPSGSAGSSSASSGGSSPAAPDQLPTLRPGNQGAAVTRLQQRLKSLGFYRGTVDGVFGSQTEQAVKQAQRHYGLEPDGIVGPATWAAILP